MKIRIIKKSPALPPEAIYIEPTLKAMQEIVGGYVEVIKLSPTVDLWCNEEGKLVGLPLNILLTHGDEVVDMVCGDFFLASHDTMGNTTSLSPGDADFWFKTLAEAWKGGKMQITDNEKPAENEDREVIYPERSPYE